MDYSVFLDFRLPNATTWVYFSFLLTLALFFQFGRLFSVRNLDLLTLFLLAPGFLLLQDAHGIFRTDPTSARAGRELTIAYAWLIAGSAYWFVRTIIDVAFVRRPALGTNLTPAGLGWLGLALFVCLTAAAVKNSDPREHVHIGKKPAPLSQVQEGAAVVVEHAQNGTDSPASAAEVRLWVERGLSLACHLAVIVALLLICRTHFQDWTAGMATVALYLLLPYTAFHIGQFHHVWPTAFLMWAVFWYRRPAVSGSLLGVAAGSSFFPLLLFPLWFGFYSKRGVGRFGVAFLAATAVSVGLMALILWWDGRMGSSVAAALHLSDWQPWKVPRTESLWTGAHWAYRLPIFVIYVAFLVAVTFWPSPKNLSHLVALSAAVLIGVQFWYADRGGVYVLWYLPLVLLVIFRPNLTNAEPPPLEPGAGMMVRIASAAWRRVRPSGANPSSKELAV